MAKGNNISGFPRPEDAANAAMDLISKYPDKNEIEYGTVIFEWKGKYYYWTDMNGDLLRGTEKMTQNGRTTRIINLHEAIGLIHGKGDDIKIVADLHSHTPFGKDNFSLPDTIAQTSIYKIKKNSKFSNFVLKRKYKYYYQACNR